MLEVLISAYINKDLIINSLSAVLSGLNNIAVSTLLMPGFFVSVVVHRDDSVYKHIVLHQQTLSLLPDKQNLH